VLAPEPRLTGHPSGGGSTQTTDHPGAELVALLAEAAEAGAITRDEARTVGSVVVGGWTCERLARAEGTPHRMVRCRRMEGIRRLSAWAAERAQGDAGDGGPPRRPA
jgi:hypothetical protein